MVIILSRKFSPPARHLLRNAYDDATLLFWSSSVSNRGTQCAFTRVIIKCSVNISRPVNVRRSIFNTALSLLIKHLVIGQRKKAPNFSSFHWSLKLVWFPLVNLS